MQKIHRFLQLLYLFCSNMLFVYFCGTNTHSHHIECRLSRVSCRLLLWYAYFYNEIKKMKLPELIDRNQLHSKTSSACDVIASISYWECKRCSCAPAPIIREYIYIMFMHHASAALFSSIATHERLALIEDSVRDRVRDRTRAHLNVKFKS